MKMHLYGWLVLMMNAAVAVAQNGLPPPGSPAGLYDWRWLARNTGEQRVMASDAWGRNALEPVQGEGGRRHYRLFGSPGPGVLDHLWTTQGNALFTLEVDGRKFWEGRFAEVVKPSASEKGEAGIPH